MEGQSSIFESNAPTSRGIGEVVLVADLDRRSASVEHAHLKVLPRLGNSVQRSRLTRNRCIQLEVNANCASAAVRGLPEPRESFRMLDLLPSIEALILRCGHRAGGPRWRNSRSQEANKKGSYDCYASVHVSTLDARFDTAVRRKVPQTDRNLSVCYCELLIGEGRIVGCARGRVAQESKLGCSARGSACGGKFPRHRVYLSYASEENTSMPGSFVRPFKKLSSTAKAAPTTFPPSW